MIGKTLALLLLIGSHAGAGGGRAERGTYSAEVVGKTVILRADGAAANDGCILATAEDRVLAALRRIGSLVRVDIVFERMPRPRFSGGGEDAIPADRMASVRGQVIAPWCNSPDLFWIRSARISSRPERGQSQ
jgi:hypothetical protein